MWQHVKLSEQIRPYVAGTISNQQTKQTNSNDVFGLRTDLTPFICHSVLLIVHLLSFIRVMCPDHFYFVLVTYWTVCPSGSLPVDGVTDSVF